MRGPARTRKDKGAVSSTAPGRRSRALTLRSVRKNARFPTSGSGNYLRPSVGAVKFPMNRGGRGGNTKGHDTADYPHKR